MIYYGSTVKSVGQDQVAIEDKEEVESETMTIQEEEENEKEKKKKKTVLPTIFVHADFEAMVEPCQIKTEMETDTDEGYLFRENLLIYSLSLEFLNETHSLPGENCTGDFIKVMDDLVSQAKVTKEIRPSNP